MKDYKRLTERDEFDNADIIGLDSHKLASGLHFDELNKLTSALNRLAELEDKIERGEIDYVADSEPDQTIIDLITEFDEMGFAPTTLHPDPEQYAIDWRDRVRKEFARQTAELEKYKRALSKVIKDRNVLAKDFYYMVEGEGQLYEDYYLGWVEHEMQEERKND